MKVEIKIPTVGESIAQVTIGNILKPSGSEVLADDELLELETDKLNQVLYAPHAGRLTLRVKSGDTLNIGDVVGFIETSAEKPVEAPKKEVAQEKKAPAAYKSPAKLSKEQFLQDIEAEKPVPLATTKKTSSSSTTRKPLPRHRKVMAERMLEATHTTAMLTTFNEADMSEIIKLRETYKELFMARHKVKLGFMSFFVKACASALQAFPMVNSSIEGNDQVFRNSIDISIAVSSERGLVVPVLRGCDKLSFAEIESQIDDYMDRAKSGSLTVDDLMGGGFTITNGGVFGSLLSTPILNPPQSAILGMHKITKRAVVIEDQVQIRPMMFLAMSYDHRVLDGREAVLFLVHIKNMLEDPHRLELGV